MSISWCRPGPRWRSSGQAALQIDDRPAVVRFYDVDQGAIEIDGQISATSPRQPPVDRPCRRTPSCSTTRSYNIAYGRPGASQAEIESAGLARIHDFVALPDGYDDGRERGLKLSGGE
jgi:ATP-binding cassette subfamily B protein